MKQIIALIGITSTFVALSSTATAADWESIEKLSDSRVYIDRSSLDTEHGDKRRVRTLISYDTEQTNTKGIRFNSMSFVDVFSCANKTRTTLSSVQYSGKVGAGKIVGSHKMGVLLPEQIRAGTVDELVLGEANCNLLSGKW